MATLINKILSEASFEGDKALNDTAKNILNELVRRVEQGKKLTKIGGGVWTKIGELEFYIFDKRSSAAHLASSKGMRAAFNGNPKNPIINSYQNITEGDNRQVDKEYIYHEIIHYLDVKRGKDKNFMLKSGTKQAKSREEFATASGKDKAEKYEKMFSDYYNSPEEFNTHFMQYVYNNIENFVLNKASLGSFDDFKKNIIEGDAKHFFKTLDEKYKKKFLKRLFIVYNNVMKNEKAGQQNGKDYKEATKSQRKSLLQKIKNFFNGTVDKK